MKPIPGYPGYYACRSGMIYSARSGQLKPLAQETHKGYLHAVVRTGYTDATERKEPVHKLMLLAYAGIRPPGYVCRHLNGNALDNRIMNLRWGSPAENARNAIRHGTAACLRHGEEHTAAKLKNRDVMEIRRLSLAGIPSAVIASRFGISIRHTQAILKRRA